MGLLSPDSGAALALLGSGLLQGNFGGGLAAASQYASGMKQRQMEEQLAQMRMQEAQMKMQEMQREQALQQQMQQAARSAMITPEKANSLSMGPMPDGSTPPMVSPGFNPQSFLAQMYQIDPLKAVALEQTLNKKDAPIKLSAGESLVDPQTYKPVFTAPKEQSLPAAIQEYQYAQGQGYRGTFEQWDRERKRAGASSVNVGVNTGERSYGTELGKLFASQDASAIEAARSAPQRVQSSQQVLRILDTQAPITGTGADARLAVSKALSTAGLIDGQTVKSTEDLASLLASQTLDAIKTSGLGGGQGFTDKDRQFLERARSGNIEMNAGTLRTLAILNEKAARASIARGRDVAKRLQGNPELGWINQGLNLEEPPAYQGPSVVRRPAGAASAPASGGVRFLGFE